MINESFFIQGRTVYFVTYSHFNSNSRFEMTPSSGTRYKDLGKHVFTFWDNNISPSLLSLDVNLDADISDILYKHCSKYNWCGFNRLGSLVHRVMFIRHQMEENKLKWGENTRTCQIRNTNLCFQVQNIFKWFIFHAQMNTTQETSEEHFSEPA